MWLFCLSWQRLGSVIVIAVHLLEWGCCNDEPSSEIYRKLLCTASHGLITVKEDALPLRQRNTTIYSLISIKNEWRMKTKVGDHKRKWREGGQRMEWALVWVISVTWPVTWACQLLWCFNSQVRASPWITFQQPSTRCTFNRLWALRTSPKSKVLILDHSKMKRVHSCFQFWDHTG